MKDFSGEGVYHETLPQHFKKIPHSHSTRFIKYSVVQNRIVIKISRIPVLSRSLRLWNKLRGAE